MNCKTCQKQLVSESLGDGKKKLKCENCGTSEIVDIAGRKYLTSDSPTPGAKLLLG